jgi:hypothetical protein
MLHDRVMLASKTFFSFTEVPEPGDHRAYNEWHQLDHRPENLRLPGVLWGERWVRSPDCAAATSAAEPPLRDLHYVNMYWFDEPVAATTAAWSALAERTFHEGRRADIHLANRLLMGFYRPIKGEAHRRIRVAADVLPFRPNRGVHVTVTQIESPRTPDAERWFAWHDTEHVPAVVAIDGVAGAWTFASESTFETALDLAGGGSPASTRVLLTYVDGDPLAVASAIDSLPTPDSGIATTVFRGPLRAITPWQWDWFDARSPA